jgi:hypothetical protein
VKLGERPAECNDTKHPSLAYRINKIRAKIYNLIVKERLIYQALNSNDSLEIILRSGKSFIRFGDAESKLMMGGDWPTQSGSRALARGIRHIFEEYSEESRYLIGVANSRLTLNAEELKRIKRYRVWRNSRFCLRKYLNRDNHLPFLEANLFRLGPDGLKREAIEQLWIDKEHVVLIHNHLHYLSWFQEKYPSIDTHLVQIPEKNFFQTLPSVQDETLTLLQKRNLDKETTVILISAGGGGKILNYNLCQRDADYLCYDMGNFFHMQLNRKAVIAEIERRRHSRNNGK